jgi:hypothetical protein
LKGGQIRSKYDFLIFSLATPFQFSLSSNLARIPLAPTTSASTSFTSLPRGARADLADLCLKSVTDNEAIPPFLDNANDIGEMLRWGLILFIRRV